MAESDKDCVLVRDIDGTFYEIPISIAESHMLKASELQSALEHFEGDKSGKTELIGMPMPMPRPIPIPPRPSWAKMSW